MKPTRARGRTLALLVTALAPLVTGAALAQDWLRVTYEVDHSRGSQTQIIGEVHNDGSADAIDVSVTAEALDGRGRVLASGITYVDSRIPRGSSRRFTAIIPPAPGAVRYRVTSSARTGMGLQAP